MSRKIRLGVLVASVSLLAAAPVAASASTTPPVSPAASATCALPAYPTPSCTGVPAGTTFTTTYNGDYTVTTNNTVINGWHITGALVIEATGVTVTNSEIDDVVDNDIDGISSSFTITDSTVGTTTCETGGWPSIDGHDFTATRVLLRGHQDGVDVTGDNVTVADSFLQPCYLPPGVVSGDGYHSDGVQDQCATTCSNLSLQHNTVDARASYEGTPTGNSALNLGSAADGEMLRTVTLKNNMFLGGGYSTDLMWDAGVNWIVTGNVWVDGSYAYAPISTEGTCGHQTWSGNSIVDINTDYQVTDTVDTTDCVD